MTDFTKLGDAFRPSGLPQGMREQPPPEVHDNGREAPRTFYPRGWGDRPLTGIRSMRPVEENRAPSMLRAAGNGLVAGGGYGSPYGYSAANPPGVTPGAWSPGHALHGPALEGKTDIDNPYIGFVINSAVVVGAGFLAANSKGTEAKISTGQANGALLAT